MSEVPVRRSARGTKVAIAQFAPILGDIDANMERHRELVARAVEEGVDLLVFPELSLTGYRLRDTVPDVAKGRFDAPLGELAGLSKEISIVAGFAEESKQHHFFNTAAYFEDGRLVSVHRKVYLPTYGMFDEDRYFSRGRFLRAFDTKFGRMAMLVCEDMLHPSMPMVAALDGADILIVPSASPTMGVTEGDADELDANGRRWEAYNRSMAASLGVFIVHANRTGVEDGITFWGGSELVGPTGESLAKAAYHEDDFIVGVLSDEALRRARIRNHMVADEDSDLVINELCRIRERTAPAREPREKPSGERSGFRAEGRFGGGDRGGDRRDNRFGGDRGGRPDNRFGGGPDRGGDRRDSRSPDRREGGFGGGGDRRDNRFGGGGGGGDRRDNRFGGGGGGDRRDNRFGGGGGGDRRDNRFGGGGGGDRRDNRFGGPPRPSGSGFGRNDDRGGRPDGGFGGPPRGGGGGFGRRDDRGGGGDRRDSRDSRFGASSGGGPSGFGRPERYGQDATGPSGPGGRRERPDKGSYKPRKFGDDGPSRGPGKPKGK